MRKHQQRQILDILETIKQAQSAGLYADCQEGSLSLCDFIESVEGNDDGGRGEETVALLVEYCELLFKAYNGEIGDRALEKHFIKIENSVKSKLKPNRIEIVFFPYQPSMFDSLESIYFAAAADPNCDAFVVPVPHYQLNPDESLGELIYNGDKYPKNIPITDWQEYDTEARHPDVIFTHYPFDDDGGNYTVHPDYYSKRLREFCELLLYVPYFVVGSGGTVAEYYGSLPGELYAHHVIVQSEKTRQSYIDHYNRYDKAYGWKGQFGKAGEKFVALGSPKFDKVINSKPCDFELPDEWKKLIYKSDGTKKKIILFNTHMFSWINGGEVYFQKLCSVFDTFKKRDDVVLWWRPHPMTEKNFKSKAPQMLDDYRRIVAEYKSAGYGIYDDTPDLTRAIKYTDAYYGDASSLIPLFQCTGNPVILTDYSKPVGFSEFNNLYDDGEFLWLTTTNVNGLFKMDKITYETQYMGSFPGESSSGRLYYSTVCCEGKLYFTPLAANDICIFDMESGEFEKVKLRDDFSGLINTKYRKDMKFSFSAVYRDYIFFFPFSYPAIVRYSTKTGKIDYIEDCIKDFDEKAVLKDAYFFRKGVTLNSTVYLFCSITKSIVSFDMESCKLRHTEQFVEVGSYTKMCYDGESIWLVNNIEPDVIIKWNIDTGEKTILSIDLLKFEQKEYQNYFVAYASGYVWLISLFGNKSIKINITSHRAVEVKEFETGNSDGSDFKPWRYWFLQQVNNKLYSFDLINKNFVEYDTTNNTLQEEVVTMPNAAHNKVSATNIYEDLLIERLNNAKILSDYVIRERNLHISSSLINLLLYPEQTNLNQSFSHQIEALANENSNFGTAGNAIYVYTKKYVLGT